MMGYERCPRSLALRAEAYLQSTGIADTAYFGPEPEFFIFDSVQWETTIGGAFIKLIRKRLNGIQVKSWKEEYWSSSRNKRWLLPCASSRFFS